VSMKFLEFLLTLGFLAGTAFGQGTYTQIDVPEAVVTEATGINRAGQIVGAYVDSAGGHGFLLQNGAFTTIDYPGVQYSYAERINDNGQIVGLAEPNGYLYDISTQAFTAITYPGAFATFSLGLNNAGTVTGYYQVLKNGQIGTLGFELTGSAFSSIAAPWSNGTSPQAISDNGTVVGSAYFRAQGAEPNFLLNQKHYREISVPNTPGALVNGINPRGTAVVGYYDSLTGVAGFVYEAGVVQTLSFPGAVSTLAFGINDAGQVVGYFLDSSLQTHGFLWTPPAAR